MRLGVLGPVVAWTSGGDPVRIPERQVRALLADLIVNGPSLTVDRLVDDLWSDRVPQRPERVIRAKISQLRRVLDDAEPGARDLVVSEPSAYRLVVDPEAVDMRRFHDGVRRAAASGEPATRARALGAALELWRGPALHEFADSAFAHNTASALEEQRLTALEDLAEARLELGEHGLLVGELAVQVRRYPMRERFRAAHVRALARAGRQDEALRTFDTFRRTLADELGVDPGPELVAAQRAVLAQEESPAPRATRRRTLPHQLGDLVGRDDEVAEVTDLARTRRLVTLTGVGGVGKTRLALQVAERAADAFPEGAHLIELAGLDTTDPDVVARHVATALGMSEPAGPAHDTACGAVSWLAESLGEASMLLLLDNGEHVVEPVAAAIARLLAVAGSVHVLTTSQEPLALRDEVVRAVNPLTIPPPGVTDVDELRRSGAVALFESRARTATAGFALTARNAPDVATICRRLDGLPLALELAATRVRSMSVAEVARRLDERFEVLVGAQRDAPPRHATLRATLDWSWELLDEQESRTLRRISVHVGSCTVEAAAAATSDEPDLLATLAVLARLVDRSLVTVVEGTTGSRYQLLESVSAYSRQRLEATGETTAVRTRHLRFYIDLAQRAETHLRGPEQGAWLARLEEESADLSAAAAWAVEVRRPEDALRIAAALGWAFIVRGRLREGAELLDAAQATRSDAGPPSALWARVRAWRIGTRVLMGGEVDLVAEGEHLLPLVDGPDRPRVEWFLGWLDLAGSTTGTARLQRALDAADAAGDRWCVAAALGTRAARHLLRGDLEACRADGERSFAEFVDLGDHWGQLQAVDSLAELAERTGDVDRAAQLRRRGLDIAHELGLWGEVPYLMTGIAHLAVLRDDLDEADAILGQARAVATERFHELGEIYVRMEQGLVARRRSDLTGAREHMTAALRWHHRTGNVPGAMHFVLVELGRVAVLAGDHPAALGHLRDGLATARDAGDPLAVAEALEAVAELATAVGRPELGVRSLGAADAIRDAGSLPVAPTSRPDAEHTRRRLRAVLAADVLDAAQAQGRRAGLEHVGALLDELAAACAWAHTSTALVEKPAPPTPA